MVLPFILSITKGKTANITDLPYPVGKETKESFPWQKDFMASYCWSLNTNPTSFETSFIASSTSIKTTPLFVSLISKATILHRSTRTAKRHVDPTSVACQWRNQVASTSWLRHSHLSTSLSCPLTPIRSHAVEPPYSGGSQNKNAMERSPDPFFPDPMTKEKKGSGYARLI